MLAGDDGVIRGPAGDGRVAAVAQDDIAAAATAVLLDPGAARGPDLRASPARGASRWPRPRPP